MSKDKVRQTLNSNVPIYTMVMAVQEYFKDEAVRHKALNYIIDKALEKQNFNTTDLLVWFIEYNKDLVANTKACQTPYQVQMLLKTIWVASNYQVQVIQMMQRKQKFLVPEEVEMVIDVLNNKKQVKEEPKVEATQVKQDVQNKPVETPEVKPSVTTGPGAEELTPGQLRALKMREAKKAKQKQRKIQEIRDKYPDLDLTDQQIEDMIAQAEALAKYAVKIPPKKE
jgi:hypothetical protein